MKLPAYLFKSTLVYGLAAAAASALICQAHAEVSGAVAPLKFTDNNGATSVDQYPGVAGQGWAGSWKSVKSRATTDISSRSGVIDEKPLTSGGGDYLCFGIISRGDSGGKHGAAISRELDSGVISLSEPVSYRFYLRPENSITDGVLYSVSSNQNAAMAGTDANDSWSINSSWSATPGAESVWVLRDGASVVRSNMPVRAGVVYLFEVYSDPQTNSWTVQISDGERTYDSYKALGRGLNYRKPSGKEGAFLHFGVTDTTVDSANELTFSVDEIEVSQRKAK